MSSLGWFQTQSIPSDLIKFTLCFWIVSWFWEDKTLTMGSHIANKHLQIHHKPPAHIPRSWKGNGHSRVCCCLRRCSCWRSCSACLRSRRAGTGSSSPGAPVAAGTRAMLAGWFSPLIPRAVDWDDIFQYYSPHPWPAGDFQVNIFHH